ncbi:MAG: DRTGG domain-containing protein [Caldicoprobacter sp.]|uniref:DRTGG domain-containing protein n=1 Tax=Caldicoprobacter sp. TaxID=2004500 RepID=UPI0039C2E121
MKIQEICNLLNATVLAGQELLDREVFSACASDLMSDILSYVKNQTILLTGLTNAHVIKMAEFLEVTAIVFVGGRMPADEVVDMARNMGIAVLATKYTMYEACGRLYSAGLPGCTRES